jgi:polyhydroxybutyrate depolymerase
MLHRFFALACAALATSDAFDQTLTIFVGPKKIKRTALLHVPANAPSSLPLVFNWHGMSLDAKEQRGLSDLDRVADKEGFAVVYPQGLARAEVYGFKLPGYTHNAGGCCSAADMDNHTTDDVAFARAILAAVAKNLTIDHKRVYSTGFSNGGFMSNRLACEASDIFAAIAPVSGILASQPNPGMASTEHFDCKPKRPVPVMHIHGTEDELVDFNGNEAYNWDSVLAYTSGWNKRNGCSAAPKLSFSNTSSSTHNNVTCTSGCGGMSNVTLCVINGGTHAWPGGTCGGALGPCTLNYAGAILHISSEPLIHAADEIWRFFHDKSL